MLRKNRPVKFLRPDSSMKKVYEAICDGSHSRTEIIEATSLKAGAVRSAITNLVFVAMVENDMDCNGRAIYILPGTVKAGKCWAGANSVFGCRFTNP